MCRDQIERVSRIFTISIKSYVVYYLLVILLPGLVMQVYEYDSTTAPNTRHSTLNTQRSALTHTQIFIYYFF